MIENNGGLKGKIYIIKFIDAIQAKELN